ncbi:LysR family transcriptional regulator [Pelagibius sp.]|uniref:LysR family transcriptional regulator n=1 Tax=Pelagibius sp. TaxID=1931238 RepID=UPI003BB1AC8A
MELLAALARHGHFARAAAECGISQPAFSARIRNLELNLGAPIVKRGNRFMGFTEEGEIALRWAHKMIADARGLDQEMERARGILSGRLTMGVVPTALTFVAKVASRLRKDHPALTIQIFSMSSGEVAKGLEDFSLDAGFTYMESALPSSSQADHIYDERYALLVPRAFAPDAAETISWQAAAAFPLCLMTPNMMNRRIIDEAFRAADAEPNCVMETNAFTVALTQVSSGIAATVATQMLLGNVHIEGDFLRLDLVDPVVEKPIGVVVSEREPALPAVDALLACVRNGPR